MEINIQDTAATIEKEIQWFEKLVDTGLKLYFQNECEYPDIREHHPPDLGSNISCSYSWLVNHYHLCFEERLLLILALIPHVRPQILDVFLVKNANINSEYVEFGGIKDGSRIGFVPTIETAYFILGGYHIQERLKLMNCISLKHRLYKTGILVADNDKDLGVFQKLSLSEEYLNFILTGKKALPQYGSKFPAKEIYTSAEWEDLIVEDSVKDDLNDIREWIIYSKLILDEWNLVKSLKPGYRALFYGPPGTGKTMAATLLGKVTGKPIFRVDLSLVVSKYIGETEKNLGMLFDEASSKDWILFFDEADALFGKRTETRVANDRYANQEIAYLLQRIEDFPGLVILATNLHTNIDEAFSRRFQSTVYFPKPKLKERRQLWQHLLVDNFEIENSDKLNDHIDKYELSGGEMINVLRYCAVRAAQRKEKKISLKDILTGIRREYDKSSKTI